MNYKLILPAFLLFLMSCSKESELDLAATGKTAETGFQEYTIQAGAQYCDKNTFRSFRGNELSYIVRFDSSAVYKTQKSSNQGDINKLFGFSDNGNLHQEYSARFGWRWSDNAMRLFAYTYNAGVRNFKELGTVALGAENACAIIADGNTYRFVLNGKTVEMTRESDSRVAEGYLLWPYFGGDEVAPHSIHIFMKQVTDTGNNQKK